jgi:hypothetical protein
MLKYNIEGNINFYESLYKSLDDDSDDEDTLCQITGAPLDSKAITLECKHNFNYEALYKEICNQRFVFKTYEYIKLSNKEQKILADSDKDYFIKCPYCRNIQFTILPYYEELGLDKKYGINSLDPSLPEKIVYTYRYKPKPHTVYAEKNMVSCYCYGVLFKPGKCCYKLNEHLNNNNLYECKNLFCAVIPNTELSYCNAHYRAGLVNHKQSLKQALKNEKEKIKNDKQKLLDEKNAERVANGLKPLKYLSKKNTVQSLIQISQYVTEDQENDNMISNVSENNMISNVNSTGCKSVLKSGPNKGKQCGCLKIFKDGMCKRHAS